MTPLSIHRPWSGMEKKFVTVTKQLFYEDKPVMKVLIFIETIQKYNSKYKWQIWKINKLDIPIPNTC